MLQFALGAALLLAPQTSSQVADPPTRAKRIDAALDAEFERQGLVGLSVALVEGGEIMEFHRGHADREGDVAAGPETMYRWASISKPVTAIRAMQLVREERLDLDADVRELVPEFPEKPWPVTARQLMGHLGGVVHYSNGKVIRSEVKYDVEHPFESVILALDRFRESPLVAEPGTRYSYTTHGYMLLGAAVERAGETPFWAQVKEHVAEPLGMTTFRPDYQWEEIPHRATGYRKVLGKVVRSGDTDVSWKLAGGGFISTARDLARFARGLLGEELLPREALDVMWTRQETAAGKRTRYGLGFGVKRMDGRLRVSHSGAQQKTRTLMQLFPDEGRALVVMTNAEYGNVGEVAQAVWAAHAEPAEDPEKK